MKKILMTECDYVERFAGIISNLPTSVKVEASSVERAKTTVDLKTISLFILGASSKEIKFARYLRSRDIVTPIIMLSNRSNRELMKAMVVLRDLNVVFASRNVSGAILWQIAKGLLEDDQHNSRTFYLAGDDPRDGTIKCLFPYQEKTDQERIGFYESAGIILDRKGKKDIVCISCQTGCEMWCSFCASSKKNVRNLNIHDLLAQIEAVNLCYGFQGDILVSLMGMGEPLKNLQNIKKLMRGTDQRYTFALSTIGLIPDLIKLVKDEEMIEFGRSGKIRLFQLSIHFPFEKMRWKYMPATRGQGLNDIITLTKEFIRKSRVQGGLNFTLFEHINDDVNCASRMSLLAKDWASIRISRANLTMTNRKLFRPTSLTKEMNVVAILEQTRIPFTVFSSSGMLVQVGCGQMAGKFVKERRLVW